jgi:hypothetical protein
VISQISQNLFRNRGEGNPKKREGDGKGREHKRKISTYPKAKALQLPDGAIVTKGSNIVRADIDSALMGSNKMTFPILSPISPVSIQLAKNHDPLVSQRNFSN